MRTFSLFITDTRYSVPTLALITVEDEQCAIELAKADLGRSEFHLAVELHDGKRAIFKKAKTIAAEGLLRA
ncbi:MAG: hypothetical protein JWO83_1108 [Caulobacteraceae bacterium]|nr:hypothetical protein [Caulobacteraceae bacterium]